MAGLSTLTAEQAGLAEWDRSPEFIPFAKIPRLFRDIIVTEKLDGSNACIIVPDDYGTVPLGAQSRKRIITPSDDNFGFARWVADNAWDLGVLLGPGRHFGEWVGPGIQSNPYALSNRHFALFNVTRWADDFERGRTVGDAFIDVVPTLYEGPFDMWEVRSALARLRGKGSVYAHGKKAEGVIIFHTASNQMFKVTCENDERAKGQTDG